MSREDANLLIAVASLMVAVAATWAAITSIRRDRADLRATGSDGAAGSASVSIVNVGQRSVRVEQLLVHRWRLVPWAGFVSPIDAWVVGQVELVSLPVVIEPGGDATLVYHTADYTNAARGQHSAMSVMDAAGRRYVVGAGHRLVMLGRAELGERALVGLVPAPVPPPTEVADLAADGDHNDAAAADQ